MNKTMKITHKKVPNGTITIGVSDESDVFTLIKNNMKKELFIQLMEQQKQMSDLKKAIDRLDYRQREILKQIKEEMETTQTKGTINVFLMKSELEDRGGVFSEEYKSPDNLFEYLNKNKVNKSL